MNFPIEKASNILLTGAMIAGVGLYQQARITDVSGGSGNYDSVSNKFIIEAPPSFPQKFLTSRIEVFEQGSSSSVAKYFNIDAGLVYQRFPKEYYFVIRID